MSHPDNTLADRLREAGATVRTLWEAPGPKGTAIAWLTGLAVNGRVVIVQTYANGHGWDAYSASPSNDIAATVADVLARCPA